MSIASRLKGNEVHIEPLLYTVRFYENGKSYQKRDEYCATLTMERFENTVHLLALNGKITKDHMNLLAKTLWEDGVEHVFAHRRGKTVEYPIHRFKERVSGE